MTEKNTAPRPLLTQWGERLDRESPLHAYPRPQMERARWQCLNGVWEYTIAGAQERAPQVYDGEIVVPFSPECVLSGVQRQLLPGQTLWYRRRVTFDSPPQGEGRLLLHFGAVDQRCKVWVNDTLAGSHEGGYWPFALDITRSARAGENAIVVAVWDDSDSGNQAWGKQRLKRGGIWYTGQSGIWQTVWCEWVPCRYISGLRITPQWRQGAVAVEIDIAGGQPCEVAEASVEVLDGGDAIARGDTQDGRLRLTLPDFKSWSPDSPFLYTLRITAGEDAVSSYFGMRDFSVIKDSAGHARLALNGEPLFHSGLLDQGYWSDGMYTPPDDEAMVWELTQIKQMGFNMLRKHIKIEPLRWYYHCDRLGLLVWQDFVSGGGPYHPLVTQALPFVGIRLRDSRHGAFGRRNEAGRDAFLRDMDRTVALLRNVVSLAVWVPFNEGWGQFDALRATQRLRGLDDSRPIDHASGWHDQGGGDFASHHIYYRHFRPRPDARGRVLALTEFGGYSHPVPDHMATESLFGYKIYEDAQALADAFAQLYETDVLRYIPQGLAAAIYTQVSDVEDEINGLFTYDRRAIKIDTQRVRAINERLLAALDKAGG